VELAFSLPGSWHRRRFTGKHMLKETFRDYLPDSIWKRRKQGFGVPLHNWFRGGLGTELDEMLELETGPLVPARVRTLLDQHRKKTRDNSYRLWSVYIYLLFLQRHRLNSMQTGSMPPR
jgi:asparagine synthase (glutamine-hydrolysing)